MAGDRYAPRTEHEFTFGLWTVGKFERDRAERLFARANVRAELASKGLK